MKLKLYTRLTMVFTAILMFSYTATSQDTITSQVTVSSDDAEEGGNNGAMTLISSDLELGEYDTWDNDPPSGIEQGLQTFGIRFNDITIPKSASILKASIQFQCDNTGDTAVQMTIYGEDVGNAPTFADVAYNITTRTKTADSAVWVVPPWATIGEAGDLQKTVDLANIVQAIVNRDDWASGNSIVFILEHSGPSLSMTHDANGREAETFDGEPLGAPACTVLLMRDNTGGVNSVRAEFSSLIYPNPTMDGVFYINNPTSDKFSYRVINITGQLIMQRDQISGDRATVHLSRSGLYIVEIMCADKVYTQKVIVE